MTLKRAIATLEKDAEFCGLEFDKYLERVMQSRGAFPRTVLEALDVYLKENQ